jgi:DNA-binding beta-propeller fold protein YncE
MKTSLFVLSGLALLLSHSAFPAGVPSLIDTINPLPGPPCFGPTRTAINTVTHRVYAVGSDGYNQRRLSVFDADSGTIVAGISFAGPININSIAVNEKTNTIYLATSTGVAVIDGATNQIKATLQGSFGFVAVVDPTTGRIFSIDPNFAPNSVSVNDGSNLSIIATIALKDGTGKTMRGSHLAIDPPTRHVYVTDANDSGNALIGVINADTLGTPSFIPTTGYLGKIVADTSSNKIYAAGYLNGQPGVVVIDGTSNTIQTTIPLPNEWDAVDPLGNLSGVDPTRHRLYLGADANANPHTLVIDTQANTVAGTLSNYGGDINVLPATGKLYIIQGFLSVHDAIGELDPSTGMLKIIVTGYHPFAFALNKSTDRVYVADQFAPELLALKGSDHSVLARILVGYSDIGDPGLAVSETLNRIYVTRVTVSDPNTGNRNAVLDVIDGSTNQVIASVTLVSFFGGSPGPVAVDDPNHRIYVAVNGSVYVLNADNNSVITSLTNVVPGGSRNSGGIAVNPITHRVYVSGGAGFGGNNVAIIDGNTNQLVKTVSAGAIPGPIAINTKTNKVFVANTGAGSVDNSVTVINGASDSVETTFSNINSNTGGDAVQSVAVDELSNTVFVGDNANGSGFNGWVTVFSADNNYSFLGEIPVGTVPVGMVFSSTSRQLFVANEQEGTIAVLGTRPPPPAPAHGGLSDTYFSVDGYASGGTVVNGTPLAFLAQQSGTPAGLNVRVQFSTTPNDASSWTSLPNGTDGFMAYDSSSLQFVLTSSSYPLSGGVYFRAISAAPSYPDSISTVVGPFNLTTNLAPPGQTVLRLVANGIRADLDFRATETPAPSGIALRVQTSTTPGSEPSWTGLTSGNSGQMTQGSDPTRFVLLMNNYPAGTGVFFRVVATVPGSIDGISNTIGPFDSVADNPPVVTVTSPAAPGAGQDIEHSFVISLDSTGAANFTISASATSNRVIKSLALLFDGSTIAEFKDGVTTGSIPYKTNVIGEHVIEAVAIDDLGATARAGTGPVFVRVVPSGTSGVKEERVAGAEQTAAASAGGNVFTLVTDGGVWDDPNTWTDGHGNHGVPGPNDLAIIGSLGVKFGLDREVGSVLLNGGRLIGPGILTIDQIITISGGSAIGFIELIINPGAVGEMINDSDFLFNGTVSNSGTWKMHGRGGITGLENFFNKGISEFQMPLIRLVTTGPDLAPDDRVVSTASFENTGSVLASGIPGLISHDGGSLISHDGGSLISHDGGSIISEHGGGVISNDGGSLISHDGGSLISHDGGSVISDNGLGLVSQGGGNFHVGAGTGADSSGKVKAATAGSGFIQTAGETDLNLIRITGPVTVNGGVLSGSGVIAGDLTVNGGYISPGHGAGLLAVTGNYTQGVQGTLIIENGGPSPSQFDQLQVGGLANLGGKLDIKTINGYTPDPADTFSPLGFESVSGSFSSVSSNAQVTVAPTGLLTSVDPTKPQPTTGQPLNIATRLQIQSGDNVLIGGFIITGPAGSTKKVLIRGIGPSLANFGVAGTIPDPFLELHKPDGSVVSNDNWQQAPNVAEIPSGFAPSNDLESIIYTTLSPGNYTAILKGAHGEAGVGLVEAYDFDTASTAKLANIATRGFVNTADNVMIGGFIIGGTEPANVLVRAIGPSLTQFGVQGALQATTLELHDANGGVISNDGWRSTQESEIQATTIPPTNDNEAAILATLVPGNYTAIVRGKNDTTGIAVVEAYNLQ